MINNKRLISLDAFRGLTIMAMILVNNPGSWSSIYAPLEHARWNGLTPTDLIFPFFIFIMGVSIALSYSKQLDAGKPKLTMYRRILFRSLKIFAVGIFLALYPYFQFSELRIVGVLQRIAIVFFVCAILFLAVSKKVQVIIGVVILIAYWVVMTKLPTPGFGRVMLEPGVNMAAWVDSFLLPGKMWNGSWDPEGIFSTFPAIASGIGGMMTGHTIINISNDIKKIVKLFLIGFMLLMIGYLWSWDFPINKNIWTSSYVLVTTGLANVILALGIYLIDVLGYNRLVKMGVIFGANAIAIYVLADLLCFVFGGISIGSASVQEHLMDLLMFCGLGAKFSSLLYALLYVVFLYVPAFILYKKKIFIKL